MIRQLGFYRPFCDRPGIGLRWITQHGYAHHLEIYWDKVWRVQHDVIKVWERRA